MSIEGPNYWNDYFLIWKDLGRIGFKNSEASYAAIG